METFQYFPEDFRGQRVKSMIEGYRPGAPWMAATDLLDEKVMEPRQRAIALARQGVVPERLRAGGVATEPALEAWKPTEPSLITGFDQGELQYDTWPGNLILPEVTVEPTRGSNGSLSIEIPTWGGEHFDLVDTQRGIDAAYGTVTADPTTNTYRLGLYGVAAKKDTRVVAKADSFLRISSRHQALAMRALLLDRERRVRNLLLDTSAYTASHAVALTTEWDNASGDSLSDWNSLFATMLATSGVPREWLTVTLCSYDSLDAAYNDPTFIAQRTSTMGTSPSQPTLAELARYWRVRRVNVADCRARISGTVQSLYGDVAIAHWDGQQAVGGDLSNLSLEDFMGSPLLGAVFVGNPGIAKVPFESNDGLKTQWIWPVDAADLPQITNYGVLGILTNVKE